MSRLLLLLPLILSLSIGGCFSGSSGGVSLDRQIGQMLILGFRGKQVDEYSPIVADIRERGIGGVVLYDRDTALASWDRNIESPTQLRALTGELQRFAGGGLIVSIDQEGGNVNRLKERYGFPPSHSAKYFGDLNDPAATRAEADVTAATLRDMGINLNFAPVVDLNVNPDNPVIGKYGRSFSADPAIVVRHASEVIDAHRAQHVATALKHFPGHGSSTADSHAGFVDVTHTWSPVELEPFAQLIEAGRADVVMTAHIFNAAWDGAHPATLSPYVLGTLLRQQLGFDGVIVSDDMQMGAITQQYGLETALELGLDAGIDLFIFANNLNYDETIGSEAVAIIKRLVDEGRVPRSRIEASYRRICALKARIGLAACG